MTHTPRICALLLALSPLAAPAVETPFYEVPYLGAGISALSPDSARDSDPAGTGYQAFGGWPLRSGHTAVEVRILDHQMRRKLGQSDYNYQTSLYADYVYDFGSSVTGAAGFFRGTKFFVNAGLGYVREDAFGEPKGFFGADVGGGLLVPLGFKGWAIRIDGRAQYEQGGICDSDFVAKGYCAKEKSGLIDSYFSAGLQIPLTIFFDKPKDVEQPDECPIAVVDPATGRRDCGAKGADGDGDGIPDSADACPSTTIGFRVDASGCALAQGYDLPAAHFFSGNSATLTPEGKRDLADLSRMLAAQPNTVAVVTVQSGAGDSAAFTLMLGEQRAAAVRQALAEAGVKAEQLADDVNTAANQGKLVLNLVVKP